MILEPRTTYPAATFVKNETGNTYTTFLSDLGIGANSPDYPTWMEHHIYDDACDCGIAIKGLNNKPTWWYLVEDDEFQNADYSLGVSAWRFKLIPEHARKHPTLADKSVIIFND